VEYDEALTFLDEHINLEVRQGRYEGLSLDAVAAVLALWGNPHEAYRVIHITGTNGKGSTARLVTRLLMAQGLQVGTYTSPHLERYNERIAIDDVPIDDDDFAQIISDLAAVEPLSGHRLSHFECLTAAALAHFANRAVDVAVVEVGVMGRYDATNVVTADVAVVTNVGRDHTDFGENWREAIAYEKAGIIKPQSTLVLGETEPSIRSFFEDERPARTLLRDQDFATVSNRLAVGGRLVDLHTPYHLHRDLFLPLHGAHQGLNAAVALTAVEAFFDRALDRQVVEEAFAEVRIPGRFEVLRHNPLVILDGAHNPDGAEAAAAVLAEGFHVEGRSLLVVGMLDGRDPADMLRGLAAETFDQIITCTPTSPRALPADELALAAAAIGLSARVAPSVDTALRWALDSAGPSDLVFISGSLYLVGSARRSLRSDAVR
jgi:dihydrofolate synthase / folylpolyglutamate synthase